MLRGTYNNYDTNWPIKAPDEAIWNVEPTATDKEKHLNTIMNKPQILINVCKDISNV